MEIRRGTANDLQQINDIYNWHTTNGFSTFLEPSTIDQRREWFLNFQENDRHILLVADSETAVYGVACSFSFRGGGVFRNTLETSIYLRSDQMGQGLGSKLYSRLFEELNGKGAHRIVVGIAQPNDGSVALHRKFGFEDIGIFDEYALYKGAYRSSLWMQKKLAR